MRSKPLTGDNKPPRGLRHGFDQQHSRHERKAGEMAFENCAGGGDRRLGANFAVGDFEVDDAIDQLKVLKTHVTRALCPLGSDEFVDARAQVFEHEILVGSCLAVVDFLGPLLERELDPEGLVDRESDIQKVQAVDTEIVDGVAFRFDGVARNIAGFSDNIGDGFER